MKIFSRGLNYHGQCGLTSKVPFTVDTFKIIPNFNIDISGIDTNLCHSYAIKEDRKTLFFWGFNWDIRSFLRTSFLYQLFPRSMKLMKKAIPVLKNFPHYPSILFESKNKIDHISAGGGHCFILDEKGLCFGVGENYYNQIDKGNNSVIYSPQLLMIDNNTRFQRVSAGFQHSIFLTTEGNVYGAGKGDRKVLGEDYNKTWNGEGLGLLPVKTDNIEGKIVDVKAGKYHSLMLTGKLILYLDRGEVYALGSNRFGQLGESNLNISVSGKPIKLEFEKDVKITKIEVGDSHNLMLSEDGKLYANGDNTTGQLNGDLDNFLYYQCSPIEVPIPDKSNIVRFWARNNRSATQLENGLFYYWGGYSYHNKYSLNNQPKYDGFNLFNEEPGIPKGAKISDIGLGYFHDLVLVA